MNFLLTWNDINAGIQKKYLNKVKQILSKNAINSNIAF